MIEGMSVEMEIGGSCGGPCFDTICVVNNNVEKAYHDSFNCSMRLCLKSREPLVKIGKRGIEFVAPSALLRYQYF